MTRKITAAVVGLFALVLCQSLWAGPICVVVAGTQNGQCCDGVCCGNLCQIQCGPCGSAGELKNERAPRPNCGEATLIASARWGLSNLNDRIDLYNAKGKGVVPVPDPPSGGSASSPGH